VEEVRELAEREDRYLLPYRGRQVTAIVVDHALTLVLDGDATVRIEGGATLSYLPLTAPARVEYPLQPATQEVADALRLFGTTVLSSVAFKSGALRLAFDSGYHVNVPNSQAFEPWCATGPGELRVVSLPGGELAVWS